MHENSIKWGWAVAKLNLEIKFRKIPRKELNKS